MGTATEAYLDNSATTRCSDTVKDLVVKVLTEDYGNASSMHMKGVEAEKYIKEASQRIAKTLRCQEKEILYTSGGTESNNLAIIGTAMANQRAGKHIITTSIEHPSVKNPMVFLEEQGFEITYLKVDQDGIIDLKQLEEAVRQDTILVSLMLINNEIGAVEPVEEAARIIHGKNPAALIHVDAVQAYGKMQIVPKRLGIDLLSVSGHKIHGPKGIGFLYIKDKTKIKPISYGGGQQKGMRSGTLNTPGIAGLGLAAQESYTDFEAKMDQLYELKSYFVQEVSKIEQAYVNGKTGRDSAPHIVSVSFEGIRSEVMLHALEDRNVYVSAGSACSFSSSIRSKYITQHRTVSGETGVNDPIQFQRVHHKRRTGSGIAGIAGFGSDASEIPETLKSIYHGRNY